MLAYVFWHRPARGADVAGYEDALRGFHAALRAHPPAGFHDSAAFAVEDAPWLPRDGCAYEDWYLVEDWNALGVLNEAAVSAPLAGSHDAAAGGTGFGAGGLYAPRNAPPSLHALDSGTAGAANAATAASAPRLADVRDSPPPVEEPVAAGPPRLGDVRTATWLAKPPGMTHDDLWCALEPIAHDSLVLQRQLVLGPAPELCVLGPQALELPDGLAATTAPRTPI